MKQRVTHCSTTSIILRNFSSVTQAHPGLSGQTFFRRGAPSPRGPGESCSTVPVYNALEHSFLLPVQADTDTSRQCTRKATDTPVVALSVSLSYHLPPSVDWSDECPCRPGRPGRRYDDSDNRNHNAAVDGPCHAWCHNIQHSIPDAVIQRFLCSGLKSNDHRPRNSRH